MKNNIAGSQEQQQQQQQAVIALNVNQRRLICTTK
jgi:hypothetical protein